MGQLIRSPTLVSGGSGHLWRSLANGHLINNCGFSTLCTDCLETQPPISVAYDDGACIMSQVGTYAFYRHYEIGEDCYWEWLYEEYGWYVRLSLDSDTGIWLGAMLYTGGGTAYFGDGAYSAKDLTSDIDCDIAGVIDHLVAAPFTLESNTATCGAGGIVSVTLNP